ncbi:serine/threonine-protein kinase [Antrihabitans stalactiti]|uniref:serine/threonine-protein kinase n=1 Tax=Antrihabitans stalactiti TaxID=2584121 RepID=UPI0030B85C37
MLLAPGDRFAGFVVASLLGEGGSSLVYRADEPSAGREVALKVLKAEAMQSGPARERFRREFEIAHSLHHPNIVEMFANGAEAGSLWLTMKPVPGVAATKLVPTRRSEPDVATLLAMLEPIAACLDFAHAAGVVHRDVKPSNILVCVSDPAASVLTDFGIARRLDDPRQRGRYGYVLGSMPYIAPEVLKAESLYPSTDQYSLACSIVEFLTGRPPFPYSTRFAIADAHRSFPPPRLSARRKWIPRSVDAVVAKALAKDPFDRYETCTQLVDLLTDLRDVVPAPPRTLRRRLEVGAKRVRGTLE